LQRLAGTRRQPLGEIEYVRQHTRIARVVKPLLQAELAPGGADDGHKSIGAGLSVSSFVRVEDRAGNAGSACELSLGETRLLASRS
jgi:hypothetical protein